MKIKFTGWVKGMRQIPFMKYLNTHTNLTLKESQDVKLKILNNEIVYLDVDNIDIAKEIIINSKDFGVVCEIVQEFI